MSTTGIMVGLLGLVILFLSPIFARIRQDSFIHRPWWARILPEPEDSSSLIIAFVCMGLLLLLIGIAMALPDDVATSVLPFLGVCFLPLAAGMVISFVFWRLGGSLDLEDAQPPERSKNDDFIDQIRL